MKKFIIIISFLSFQAVNAQQNSSYADLLKPIKEVEVNDSLLLKAVEMQINPLDTFTIKKWFSHALSVINNNRLKNREYYLTGKITTNNNYDLLLVVEEKLRSDATNMQVVYLVSTKKDGGYISSLEVAVAGLKNESTYNTSSHLFKDNKIKLDTKFNLNDTTYADMSMYKINKNGRFLLAPSY